MMPEVEVILGVVLLSAVLSYAWWVRFRVWMLRQDLFDIRDELWNEMRSRELLDDPAHRWLREALNAFIRLAPVLSIWTVLRIMAEGPRESGLLNSENLPEPVRAAWEKAKTRLAHYLVYETISGRLFLGTIVVYTLVIRVPSELAQAWFGKWLARVFDSDQIRAEGRLLADGSSVLGSI